MVLVRAGRQAVWGHVSSRSERQALLRIHLLFVRVLKGSPFKVIGSLLCICKQACNVAHFSVDMLSN